MNLYKLYLAALCLVTTLAGAAEEIAAPTYAENTVGYFFLTVDAADGEVTPAQTDRLVSAYQGAAAAFVKTVAIMDPKLAATASDACKAVGIEQPEGIIKRLRKWVEEEEAAEMEFTAAVGFHAAERCGSAIGLP